jgi:hypothetical protein
MKEKPSISCLQVARSTPMEGWNNEKDWTHEKLGLSNGFRIACPAIHDYWAGIRPQIAP